MRSEDVGARARLEAAFTWQRALLLAGSLLLIFPGAWGDTAGLLCFVVVVISQRAARSAGATEAA